MNRISDDESGFTVHSLDSGLNEILTGTVFGTIDSIKPERMASDFALAIRVSLTYTHYGINSIVVTHISRALAIYNSGQVLLHSLSDYYSGFRSYEEDDWNNAVQVITRVLSERKFVPRLHIVYSTDSYAERVAMGFMNKECPFDDLNRPPGHRCARHGNQR